MTHSWIMRLSRSESADKKLLCFPHAGGGPNAFRKWANYVPDDIELFAVCYPGREARLGEPFTTDFYEIVRKVSAELRQRDARPLSIFGHSMGASLAHETAAVLERDSLGQVSSLIVSGREAPSHIRQACVHKYSDAAFREELVKTGGVSEDLLAEDGLCAMYLPIIRNDYELIETYEPSGLDVSCPLSAYYSSDDEEVDPDGMEAWFSVTTGGFRMRCFDGGHFYLFDHPKTFVEAVVSAVRDGRVK